jgi:hypothetical protein
MNTFPLPCRLSFKKKVWLSILLTVTCLAIYTFYAGVLRPNNPRAIAAYALECFEAYEVFLLYPLFYNRGDFDQLKLFAFGKDNRLPLMRHYKLVEQKVSSKSTTIIAEVTVDRGDTKQIYFRLARKDDKWFIKSITNPPSLRTTKVSTQ